VAVFAKGAYGPVNFKTNNWFKEAIDSLFKMVPKTYYSKAQIILFSVHFFLCAHKINILYMEKVGVLSKTVIELKMRN
jgi:hypothetical protein